MITDEKTKSLLIEQFATARDRWTDQRLLIGQRSNDLQVGVSERNFQLVLALVSISVAFLTIVIPIAQDNFQNSLFFPTIFSFLAALIGIVHLFLGAWWDRKVIPEDSKFYIDIFGEFQDSATKIYNKLYLDEIPKDDIEAHTKLHDNVGKRIQERKDEREKSYIPRLINFLYYAFLVIFAISFISLFFILLSDFFSQNVVNCWADQYSPIHRSRFIYFR